MAELTEEQYGSLTKRIESKECCAGCRYWKEHDAPTLNDSEPCKLLSKLLDVELPIDFTGDCHRYPPVQFLEFLEEGQDSKGVWPATDWDSWCGEFKKGSNEQIH